MAAERPSWIDGPADARPWWTLGDVADRMRCSADKIERMVKAGELRHVQLWPGKKGRRIAGTELARYEAARILASAPKGAPPLAPSPVRKKRRCLGERKAIHS